MKQSKLRIAFFSQLGKVHVIIVTMGGVEDFEGGAPKFLDTWTGGSEKIVGLGGGSPKICILQNQQEGKGGGLLKNWTVSEGGGC